MELATLVLLCYPALCAGYGYSLRPWHGARRRNGDAHDQAKREGREEALRLIRIALLEKGDVPMNGFSAAEIVRELGDELGD